MGKMRTENVIIIIIIIISGRESSASNMKVIDSQGTHMPIKFIGYFVLKGTFIW